MVELTISIYTLSALGDSTSLIGSLSQSTNCMTLYSPLYALGCKLGVLPKFQSKNFLKIQEYSNVDDSEGKKRLHVPC